MSEKKNIYLVVSVFNENETINTFINACDEALKELKAKYNFYYLFSNDGSSDNTLEILKNFAKEKDYVKYLSFSRNFGKEAGIYAAMQVAYANGADAVIPMDVDLQDPPSMIPEFITYWEQGYQVVYAHMRSRAHQKFLKRFFSSAFYKVYNILTPIKTIKSGDRDFSIIDRTILEKIVAIKDKKRFLRGIIAYCCPKNKKRIDYDYVERTQGTSKFPFKKMIRYSKDAILEFWNPFLLLVQFFAFVSFVVFVVFLILGLVNSNLWFNYIPMSVSLVLFVLLTFTCFPLNRYSKKHHKTKHEIDFEIQESNLTKLN